ncbi:hypothetical protein Tco_1338421 [Tanacetum coccineum]
MDQFIIPPFLKDQDGRNLVIRPKWKTFICQFNKQRCGHGAFHYDPASYLLNFNEGPWLLEEDDDDDQMFRKFSESPNSHVQFRRTSLTGFPAQSIRPITRLQLDSPYLLVLIPIRLKADNIGKGESKIDYYLPGLSRPIHKLTKMISIDTELDSYRSRKSPTKSLFECLAQERFPSSRSAY